MARLCCILFLVSWTSQLISHPLDPFSKPELQSVVSALQKNNYLGNGWYVQMVVPVEPGKASGRKGRYIGGENRRATVIAINLKNNKNLELEIDVASGKIINTQTISGGQPALMDFELSHVATQVRKDSQWQLAMLKRGITNFEHVHVEPWAPGDLSGQSIDATHRIIRATFFLRGGEGNAYGKPIEGVTVLFDSTSNQVLSVADTGVVPLNSSHTDFFQDSKSSSNHTFASQKLPKNEVPNPAVKRKGHEINWKAWHLRVVPHAREGLVLYDVGISDNNKVRSILYRASMSEMVVPYADPDGNWHWRCAFDQGDYGIGMMTHPLVSGVHVPNDAQFFDLDYIDNHGKVRTIPRAIAAFERDGGLLWSHYDAGTGRIAAKRSKELVVFQMYTVGNYDYGMEWAFREDGGVDLHMILTGVIQGKGTSLSSCARCKVPVSVKTSGQRIMIGDRYGTVVDTNVIGVAHQHFFNFRLDFDIDGSKNSIAELSAKPIADRKENPSGNAFSIEENFITSELTAGRDASAKEGRRWWIHNPNKRNVLGHFAGYLLESGPTALPMAQPDSEILAKAGFINHHFWATRYHADEMHPAGDYPSQNRMKGIPQWIARDESLLNEDVVVWYNVGITHIPAAEDWPIMPAVRAGFLLRPKGFFVNNLSSPMGGQKNFEEAI